MILLSAPRQRGRPAQELGACTSTRIISARALARILRLTRRAQTHSPSQDASSTPDSPKAARVCARASGRARAGRLVLRPPTTITTARPACPPSRASTERARSGAQSAPEAGLG